VPNPAFLRKTLHVAVLPGAAQRHANPEPYTESIAGRYGASAASGKGRRMPPLTMIDFRGNGHFLLSRKWRE